MGLAWSFVAGVAAKGIYHQANLQAKQKKVGRPIAYKGDPSAPNLTDMERRRIKRRIANRESARRVRARRQETLKELQIKVLFHLIKLARLTYICEQVLSQLHQVYFMMDDRQAKQSEGQVAQVACCSVVLLWQ